MSVLNHMYANIRKKQRNTSVEDMFYIADSTSRRKSENLRKSLFRQLRGVKLHNYKSVIDYKNIEIFLFFLTLE